MTAGAQPVPAVGREEVLDLVERHHAILRDAHLARKLFRPMAEQDKQRAAEIEGHVKDATAAGMTYPEVWAELVRMQQRKTGWTGALLLLVISLALFIGIGAWQWEWEFVLLIVGLLAFHELGHFVAMKVFGYRNVRMFFIPLLGAAVSGVHYSAPGWKKVIVALMGPLPGIVLGAVAGVVGLYLHNDLLLKIALLALFLNGFNLLPVLPLDGGRVMHTLLFARHWVLDVIFRLGAAIALLAASYAFGDRIVMFLGIFMLIGIPATYKLARVASDLKRQGVRRATPDEKMVPPDVAEQIIARLRQSFPMTMSSRTTAQHTLNIYETINTRTPGWLATTAFTIVHVAAVLFVVLAGSLLVVAQRGGIGPLFDTARAAAAQERPPKNVVGVADMRKIEGGSAAAAVPTTAPSTIVANFSSTAGATAAFDEIQARPDHPAMSLFGQTVMLRVADRAMRERWFDEMDRRTRDTFVASPRARNTVAIDCLASIANDPEKIVEEAKEYLDIPEDVFLIPPWSPLYDPARRDEWRRARRTFVKFHHDVDAFKDERFAKINARMTELRRRGDEEAITALMEEQSKLYQQLRSEHRRAMLDDPSIDRELAAAYIKVMERYHANAKAAAAAAADDEEEASVEGDGLLRDFQRELGPRMGQIELKEGKPVNGSDRFSAGLGSASDAGLFVQFRWMTFADPMEGLPALVRWLAGQNCHGFHYEFNYSARGPYFGAEGAPVVAGED